MKSLRHLKPVVSMILLFSLWACAQAPVARDTQPADPEPNPLASVAGLETDIAAAKQNQSHILSPDWFAKAEKYHAAARKGAEEGAEISKILESVDQGHQALQKAAETTKVAKTLLPEVLGKRDKALAAGAGSLGKDYDAVEERFLKLTRAIENNNINYTQKNAPRVADAYSDLELQAIKAGTIETVRPVIEQAENEKAGKYVPRSLALAQQYFEDTDDFISGSRYATEAVNQRVQESMFAARRALVLNNQSKKIETMKPEEIALWMEENLHQITKQLAVEDMRNRSENLQIENIVASIQSLQAENRTLKEQVIDRQQELQEQAAAYQSNIAILNQRIAVLEGTAAEDQKVKTNLLAEQRAIERRLKAEREFNEKFLEVQTFFRTHEAEVYKQRNQLVIRLKAMQFPIGTAIIMPENYALLSKVQRAIQVFDKPSVVVEGHTDSTGLEETNQALSNQRAAAVKEYLVANQTISADKIIFKGYGSSRPLASNATPEGRAINRRIDLVINPSLVPAP